MKASLGLTTASVGWLVGASLLLHAAGLVDLSFPIDLDPQPAEATSSPRLSDEAARQVGSDWVGPYLETTVATEVVKDGRPVQIEDLELVDVRFIAGATDLVTSIESGVSLGIPTDVWVISWDIPGVDNPQSGARDATAYLVVTIDDTDGRVRAATAGLRQPEDQARARDPLPEFDELFPPGNTSEDCVDLAELRAARGPGVHTADPDQSVPLCR